MQEESGEILFKDSNGEAVWLCPLCQQGQEDRSSLSLHLTEQHNVLSACVDKLLDIAILKQCANGREENRGAKQSTDTSLLLHLKASEDSTSQPSQSEENLDAAQQPGDKVMEEERAAEQEGGAAQPEWEQEGTQPAGEKTLNVTASDLNDKKSDKKPVGSESNTRSFKCNACLETFHTKTALCVHYNSASHIQRMTMGSAKQLGENEPQTPAVPVLSRPYISNKPYQCAVCRVSYNHAITLESHMKSVLHQTRSRSAGNAANSAAAAAGASGASSNSAPNTAAGPGTAQVAAATTNCPSSAVPGNVIVTAKSGEQIQVSAAVPSLLSSPVASAQAVSAFLTLLTSGQSSLSHSLFPSLFTPSAAPGAPPAVPGAPAPQLVSQPHMLMPLILNGLQAQTQQQPENQSGQLLTQCVPLLGLSAAQQALVTQRLSTLQSQWPSVGIKPATQPCQDELKQGVKCEEDKVKQEGYKTGDKVPVKTEDGDSWTLESLEMGGEGKESAQSMKSESKLVKTEKDGDNGRAHGENGADGDCSTDQLALEEDEKASLNLSLTATEKVFRNNNPSPSASIPSSSSLSPVNLNLTLSPDSTPQKSQPGTSPCSSLGSPKASPYKTALMSPDQTRSASNMRGWYTPPGPPVLSEFQSEVLWAFFESRSEADAASPPRDDCEALGREVGLSEEEVRMWLSQVRQAKERQRATGTEPRTRGPEGEARYHGSSDNDYYDEEESALVIAEGEDSADTSGSQAIDLSNRRGKRRKRELGREGHGDSCLTSDSENEEVYTSVIVSEEESQNGSTRGGPVSPRKDEMLEVASDRVLGGGKVLRSTTVFLSDAEDEYEEEENAAGRRGSSKKRQMAFEHDELEIKKGRLDPDVDLELEAQGDPPSAQPHSLDHSDLRSGLVHSLPLSLSLTPFSAQFLSPYVLSVPSTMAAEAGKVQAFPNPPNITRFSDAILTQTLSSLGQASHCLSNGGDCESALDLSMGKNGNSKSSSSSVVADKTSAQKGRLLDGLGLRPTSKGLVVVKVKPDSVAATTSPNSSSSLINCNKVSKSSIYMRAAEKMNATLLEREREKERQKERDGEQQQQRPKGKRYRDMRRSRTIIQAEQLDILYGCYFKDPNPGKHEFEQISEWVHLPKKVVQIWFQNMRARERKGEVRFISDGTLAAVGKPLIKFTWPLSKPIFSHKPIANNTGCITTAPIVRTLIKNDKDLAMEVSKAILVKKQTPVPIKPKEVVSSTAASHVSSSASVVPKTKLETTSNVTIVQVAPKANAPVVLAAPKEPIAIAPRPPLKRKPQGESEEEKTDEEMDNENETGSGPGTTNRMVPKLPTTPINNKHPATVVASQKQNGLNYWTPKGPYKINTLSREQLALPTPPRTIPPPPTPSIAPVSPNTPSSGKAASPATPALAKSSPTESSFMTHSSSRRPRTHLSCLQLSILQSCYETCAHPNAMECEAIGTELGLPLKVVQIWFQNTRAKEKRWRLQQEKMSLPSAGKMDTSSGSYLQYNALRANRPILPKPVQLTVIEPAASPVTGQPAPKETLMGRCEACSTCFESRAAARAHVFSPRHLATLRTTNFGQPTTLVNKNGTGSSGSVGGSQAAQSGSGRASGAEAAVESPPPKAGSAS